MFKIRIGNYCPNCLSKYVVNLYNDNQGKRMYCRECGKVFRAGYERGVHLVWLQ